MTKGPCSVDGCTRPAWARGWCHPHYRRWYLYGEPEADQPTGLPTIAPTCSVDGCHKPARGRGWCAKHYGRWQRAGDPLAPTRAYTPAPSDGLCTVEGCGRVHYARGLCDGHYRQQRQAPSHL